MKYAIRIGCLVNKHCENMPIYSLAAVLLKKPNAYASGFSFF
jgi:hypothetical protein